MRNYMRLFNITEFAAILEGLPSRYKVDFIMDFNRYGASRDGGIPFASWF